MVRPEYRDAVSKIIYANGEAFIENADAALQFINKNPVMLSVDWSDEKILLTLFLSGIATKLNIQLMLKTMVKETLLM